MPETQNAAREMGPAAGVPNAVQARPSALGSWQVADGGKAGARKSERHRLRDLEAWHDVTPALRAALVVWLAVPLAGFTVAYTELGFGVRVFRALNNHYDTAVSLGGLATFLLLAAYVLDVFVGIGGQTVAARVKQAFVSVLSVLFGLALVLSVQRFPTAPACLFAVIEVAFIAVARTTFCAKLDTGVFVNLLGWTMALVGTVLGIVWVAWVASGNNYDDARVDRLERELECHKLHDAKHYEDCLAAYLMWMWPGAAAFMCGLFAAVAIYVSRTLLLKDAISAARGLAKFMLAMCLIGVLTLWVAASIAGVKMGLANVVLQFSVLTIGLMMFLAYTALGGAAIGSTLHSVALFRKFEEYTESDIVKSFIVLLFLPQLLFYVLLSTFNQAARRLFASTGLLANPENDTRINDVASPAQGHASPSLSRTTSVSSVSAQDPSPLHDQLGFLTLKCRTQVERLLVRPTSIIVKAHWWAVLYFSLDVGAGKFVIIFLSWFSEVIQELNTGLVFVIFVIVGITLFLLPPVPGPPVYLCAGIVLVRKMEPDHGFWPAIVTSIFSAFAVKIMACALQQKVIGENFADNLWVRKTLGVNSVTLRAIKFCIEKPGLSPAKVAILCGGPDWPVSVTCGVLRLPLGQILLGTTPVLVLYIAESVLAAGFQLKKDEGGSWESLANVAIGVTAVAMMLTMFSALYYLEDTIDKHHDHLMDESIYPFDKEVQAAEEEEEEHEADRFNKTRWWCLPTWLKFVLVTGLVCMSISCYAFAVFGSQCFVEFGVENRIADLPGGRVYNIILPLGYVAIGIFFVGCACLHTFRFWAAIQLRERMDEKAAASAAAKADPELRHADSAPAVMAPGTPGRRRRASIYDQLSPTTPSLTPAGDVLNPISDGAGVQTGTGAA